MTLFSREAPTIADYGISVIEVTNGTTCVSVTTIVFVIGSRRRFQEKRLSAGFRVRGSGGVRIEVDCARPNIGSWCGI